MTVTKMSPDREERRRRQKELADQLKESGALDGIFAKIDAGEPLTGQDGLLGGMLKAALERGLETELTEHVGYERGAADASLFPNSRNGTSPKTVATEIGDIELAMPRDRNGTFTPMLVAKGQRRLDGLDGMIISLYAGGMTIRDIQHHLATTIGTELSHETISKVTDQIAEEVLAWQNRPLEALYPVIYLDAIIVKIRDGAHVRNKAAHIAVGVDMDGIKHVLGIWVQATEGAKFWAGVCAELANRGVRDVLVVCCDGLTGFPEAVAATWPQATVQTCVVHLIRAAMRFVNYKDRKALAAALKPIYTAANEDAALEALEVFETGQLGRRYPSAVKTFHDAWDRFTPFLAFPPELRRVIYTTNSIESLNYQLRKVTKNRGHFPNDAAAVKLLWLAICNIEDKRARDRAKELGNGRGNRKAEGRLVEGAVTTNWKQALQQLALAYPDVTAIRQPGPRIRPAPLKEPNTDRLQADNWPRVVLVTDPVNRYPSTSSNRNCAPGRGRSRRTMIRMLSTAPRTSPPRCGWCGTSIRPAAAQWLGMARRQAREQHHMAAAVADVAHTVATHHLQTHQLHKARHVTEAALLAVPDDYNLQADLLEITMAEGHPEIALRMYQEMCNQPDGDGIPAEVGARIDQVLAKLDWKRAARAS